MARDGQDQEWSMQSKIIVKPRIVVSECLNLAACRYNGEVIRDSFLARLAPHVEFLPVCPEVAIGLGTPRPPVRLVAASKDSPDVRLIQPARGNRDLTQRMRTFSRHFLDALTGVDGFILKKASPSCAVKDAKRFPSPGKSPSLGKGPGLFASDVLQRFSHLPIEDEGRLTNLRLREHFLIRIFTGARWRCMSTNPGMSSLVRFHSCHKLLLMAYNQKEMRALGRIVANPDGASVAEVVAKYETHLAVALGRLPRYTSHINVLMHAFGYFSRQLSTRERVHFLDLLEQYRAEQTSLGSALRLLESWILRFESTYLADQIYLRPFPIALVHGKDSGKGRLQ